MYSQVKVLKLNSDKTVTVGCSSEACQGCKAEMFCNNKHDNTFVVLNSKNLQLKVGDSVEIFLHPGKTIASTLLVFAFPLVLFPIGYLAAKFFWALNELLCALGGFTAMAVAFAVTAIINIKKRDTLMPVVVRVLGDDVCSG